MNLILDIGNTIAKLAIFEKGEIIHFEKREKIGIDFLKNLFKNQPAIRCGILSSVRKDASELNRFLHSSLKEYIVLDQHVPLPVKNLYTSPESLEYDRISGVVGANTMHPGRNILVIDAGTALTFNFLNSKGEFLGGNISPGARLRARALNEFTSRLPLVEPREEYQLLGNSTETALVNGIMNGIVFEMDQYINTLKFKHKDLACYLTGGDHYLFEKKLKNHIFVDSKLNLKGLNRILEYNVDK